MAQAAACSADLASWKFIDQRGQVGFGGLVDHEAVVLDFFLSRTAVHVRLPAPEGQACAEGVPYIHKVERKTDDGDRQNYLTRIERSLGPASRFLSFPRPAAKPGLTETGSEAGLGGEQLCTWHFMSNRWVLVSVVPERSTIPFTGRLAWWPAAREEKGGAAPLHGSIEPSTITRQRATTLGCGITHGCLGDLE